jgi:hypothetical protein
MVDVAMIDMTDVSVTPVFKYIELENVPQSALAGHEVRRSLEVVEVHTAGSRNAIPVFPVDAQWRRDGNNVITYAQRWEKQYRAFKEGGPQDALGTPLEMLRPLGITPEQISMCKANRIYSVEALNVLSQDGIRNLGVHANKLREAAKAHMAGKDGLATALGQIDELKAQIAALSAGTAPVVEPVTDAYPDMSDAQLKDEIAKLNEGKRPQGNPSRPTLVSMLNGLMEA